MEKEIVSVDTEIIDKKDKLNKIKLDLSREHDTNHDYSFEDSTTREAINKLGFDNEDKYFFFKTSVNPEADEFIRKTYKRKNKKQALRNWHFTTGMMGYLLELIHELNQLHEYFPLIVNIDVHSSSTHAEQNYWPIIHILKNLTETRKKEYIRSVEHILTDHFDKIEKYEHPHDYNLKEYQLLKEKGIKPLLIQEGPIFTGAELKKSVDWLLQYQYKMKYRSHDNYD
jgi:hypothetical protein